VLTTAATLMFSGEPEVVAAVVGVVPDGADGVIVTVQVPAVDAETAVTETEFGLAAEAPSPNVTLPAPLHAPVVLTPTT